MVEAGNIVYLRLADAPGRREMLAGLVADFAAPSVTVEFQEILSLLSGHQAGLCYKVNDKLFCMPVTVQMVLESRPRTVIRFTICGDPVPCEGRQVLRVSTVAENIAVDSGSSSMGKLMDVSGDGLAATLVSKHKPQDIINVNITFRGQRFTGKATVCNIRDLGDGRFRYGMKPRPREVELTRGLQMISSTLARERRQREVERAAR